MNKLGLINYEGDCLKAIKNDGKIDIKDQYGEIVNVFSVAELYSFIDGTINITDSQGRSWNYPETHENAKPSLFKLHNFLKQL